MPASLKAQAGKGGWVATFVGVPSILVNLDALKAKNLQPPKDWADLANPAYKGLIGVRTPGQAGEGDAFFKLGEHQFLAIFEVDKVQRANMRHFGIMVRDEAQLSEVRKKLTGKYKLKLQPPFRCDFRDPWGNRIQVVDLHDESLVWLLPYGEVQKSGVKFAN